jgi:hypothetical protein
MAQPCNSHVRASDMRMPFGIFPLWSFLHGVGTNFGRNPRAEITTFASSLASSCRARPPRSIQQNGAILMLRIQYPFVHERHTRREAGRESYLPRDTEAAGSPRGGCATHICTPVLQVRVVNKRLRSGANISKHTRGHPREVPIVKVRHTYSHRTA